MKSWTLQYRLKIDATLNGVPIEASGVFRSRYRKVTGYALNQTRAFAVRGWGEAIPIDLGHGRLLVAALRQLTDIPSSHVFDPLGERTLLGPVGSEQFDADTFHSGVLFDRVSALRGPQALPVNMWPVFLHFRDGRNRDGATLVRLHGQTYGAPAATPSTSLNSLNVSIHAVTFEMTTETQTQRIADVLPWLPDTVGAKPGLQALNSRRPLPERLKYDNFKLEGIQR